MHNFMLLWSLTIIPARYILFKNKTITFDLEYYFKEYFDFVINNYLNKFTNIDIYLFYRNVNPICSNKFHGEWLTQTNEYKYLYNNYYINNKYRYILNNSLIKKCIHYYKSLGIKNIDNNNLNITILTHKYKYLNYTLNINGFDLCLKNGFDQIGAKTANKRLKLWVNDKQYELLNNNDNNNNNNNNHLQLIYYNSYKLLNSFNQTCNDYKWFIFNRYLYFN